MFGVEPLCTFECNAEKLDKEFALVEAVHVKDTVVVLMNRAYRAQGRADMLDTRGQLGGLGKAQSWSRRKVRVLHPGRQEWCEGRGSLGFCFRASHCRCITPKP